MQNGKEKIWSIETKRLMIRRAMPVNEDIRVLKELWNDPEVMRNVGFPKGLNTNSEKIESQFRNQADSEYDCVLLVVLKSLEKLIGQCKLGAPDSDMVAHTDVKLLPRYWGNRYGVEIKRALLGYLFSNTLCRQVTVDPNINNEASIRMQEAVGGRKTGEGVHQFPKEMRDYTTDIRYVEYTVFREDWRP